MMPSPSLCLLVLAAVVVTAQTRSTAAEMRRALGGSPVFSHKRNRPAPVPQNVNIVLPASDPDAQPRKSGSSITAGRPALQQQSHVREQQSGVAGTQPIDVNDRLMNKQPIPAKETNKKKQECSFQVPSFLTPDGPSSTGSSQRCPSFLLPGPGINPNLVTLLVEHWTGVSRGANAQLNNVKSLISQMEFEQKCLVPALRAHVLGGSACRSRELTVYLEWLLYLRQKLFNI